MFKNREEAGTELALRLQAYKDKKVVVLAIPRGGLPLGAIIAKKLDAPLDVAITKKIGHPMNKEYAVGALNKQGYVLNPDVQLPEKALQEEIRKVQKQVEEKHEQYYSKGAPQELKAKWVVIVDDGMATGSTVLATVQLVGQQHPAGIVIATPVAPPRTVQKLKQTEGVHEVVCLEQPVYFQGVGQFYEDFYPVSDQEAISLLEKARSRQGDRSRKED